MSELPSDSLFLVKMDSNSVVGLPKTVDILLQTLCNENGLISWNVTCGKRNIIVKLKFNSDSHSTEISSDNLPRFYKKKPPCAIARDKSRLESFRNKKSESGFFYVSEKNFEGENTCSGYDEQSGSAIFQVPPGEPDVMPSHPSTCSSIVDNLPVPCQRTPSVDHTGIISSPFSIH